MRAPIDFAKAKLLTQGVVYEDHILLIISICLFSSTWCCSPKRYVPVEAARQARGSSVPYRPAVVADSSFRRHLRLRKLANLLAETIYASLLVN